MPSRDLPMLLRAQREVDRRDRKYHFRTYEDCFLGTDLVQRLQNAYQVGEEEALVIGRRWQSEHKWLEHVVYNHQLKNKKLFYRWKVHRMVDRNSPTCSSPRVRTSSGDISPDSVWLEFSSRQFKKFLQVLQPSVVMRNLIHPETGVKVRTHRTILRTFRQCFSGQDAVNWVEDRFFLERPEAVQLLEKLMKLGHFQPINRKYAFIDGPPLYTTDDAWQSSDAPLSLVFHRELIATMHHTFRTRESLPQNIYSVSSTNLRSLSQSECYYHDNLNSSSLPVHIPVLVEYCISHLQGEEMLHTEGVFRLSAPSAAISRLAIVIGCCSDGGSVVLNALRANCLPLVLAQLLKLFLMELPQGILSEEAKWLDWKTLAPTKTPTLVNQGRQASIKLRHFLAGRRVSNQHARRKLKRTRDSATSCCAVCSTPIAFNVAGEVTSLTRSVRSKVLALPGCRIAILHRLITLLDAVRSSPQTKLSDRGLASIFAPILVRDLSDDIKKYVEQVDVITDLIVFLINNHHDVFQVFSGTSPPRQKRVEPSRVESIRPRSLDRSSSFHLELHHSHERKRIVISQEGHIRRHRAQTGAF